MRVEIARNWTVAFSAHTPRLAQKPTCLAVSPSLATTSLQEVRSYEFFSHSIVLRPRLENAKAEKLEVSDWTAHETSEDQDSDDDEDDESTEDDSDE